MAENQPIKGNIHTVFIEVPDNGKRRNSLVNHICITSDYTTNRKGEMVRHMRFNPNKNILRAQHGEESTPCEECICLIQFEKYLHTCLIEEGVLSVSQMARLDFKIDYSNSQALDSWVKICDLLIGAFIVKHHVSEKNQYRCTTVIEGRHKSTKATWGRYELENYNKAIQQERNGNQYRFEIRCLDTNNKSVVAVLRGLQKELKSLEHYYKTALSEWNMVLYKRWIDKQAHTQDAIRLNEFIRWNDNQIFSRNQMRDLYALAYNGTPPKRGVDNYCRNNEHLFISETQFLEHIKQICKAIDIYISGDVY